MGTAYLTPRDLKDSFLAGCCGVLGLMNCAKHKDFLIVDIIDIMGFGELSM
jgi:hypothetical protein